MSQNTVDITVRSTDQSARGLDQAAKNAGKFKDTLREIGKTATGVLTADIAMKAAQGFKNLVTDSVKQASDLNESLNAVNVTFGASAKEITDWGKSNAASFGLSQSAFNAMATPLGAMLKNTGLSMQDTTKWTIDLTKRAADMASVFNTSVPDALEAIQAGLRGEADPLERYGVGLSAAKVQAEALAETGKKTANALTTQELATARLNIIMKQTSQTQGDFQNTSDGAANAARIASAQFDNAKASLGNALLPILAKAATAAAALAEGFNALPGPMQATIVIVGALGTAAVLLTPKIRAAKTELQNLGNGALSAETKLGGLARGAGKVAGALGAMATASALMSSDAGAKGVDTTRKALEELRKSGKDSTGALEHIDFDLRNINQSGRGAGASIETFTGFIAEGLGRGWEKIDAVNQRMQALDASLAGMVQSGNAKEAADDFELLRRKAEEQGTSVEKLKEFFPQYQNALDAAARQTQQTGGATEDLTKKLDEEREALNKAENALLGQRDAMRGLEAAYDDASEAVKKNGKTLDIGTEKGRANQAALDNIASAAYKARDAIIEQGGSQAKANAVMVAARGHFINTARAMGVEAGEAKKLANQLFAIPKTVTTTPKLNTSVVDAQVTALRAKLAALNGVLSVPLGAGRYGQGLGVYRSPSSMPSALSRTAGGRVTGKVMAAATPEMILGGAPYDEEADIKNRLYSLYPKLAPLESADKKRKQAEAAQQEAEAVLAQRSANRELEAALDAASEARKKSGRTLDVHTKKGRDNQAALDAIATAANNTASAVLAAGGSTEKAAAMIAKAEPQLVGMAQRFGLTHKQALAYAKSVLAIPSRATTKVTLDLSEAQSQIEALQALLLDVRQRKAQAAADEAQRIADAAARQAIDDAERQASQTTINVYATTTDPGQIESAVVWGAKVAGL